MAPSSSAIIGGRAATHCGGEGGTSPWVYLDEVWEALCFLRYFCDELNFIIFAKLILCTRGFHHQEETRGGGKSAMRTRRRRRRRRLSLLRRRAIEAWFRGSPCRANGNQNGLHNGPLWSRAETADANVRLTKYIDPRAKAAAVALAPNGLSLEDWHPEQYARVVSDPKQPPEQ